VYTFGGGAVRRARVGRVGALGGRIMLSVQFLCALQDFYFRAFACAVKYAEHHNSKVKPLCECSRHFAADGALMSPSVFCIYLRGFTHFSSLTLIV
jgi:hypothetical protein